CRGATWNSLRTAPVAGELDGEGAVVPRTVVIAQSRGEARLMPGSQRRQRPRDVHDPDLVAGCLAGVLRAPHGQQRVTPRQMDPHLLDLTGQVGEESQQ